MTGESGTRRHYAARRFRWPVGAVAGCLISPATALALDSQDADAERESIEEIIVTARKIEESVQDIPMSVQVLSGELLDEADLTRLHDLQFYIPGLVVANLGGFGAGLALRGITDQSGSRMSIASHLNGVPLGDAGLTVARLFDLDRIEVLKGPQGTLYGRNATGGSINFVTRTPVDEFSAEIEAAYGSFETARVQGHVNLPFGPAALRMAFIGSEGDGYIRNSVDDRKFAENDFWGLRASLLYNVSENLQLTITAQSLRDDGATGELWLTNPSILADPRDIRLTTVTLPDPFLKTRNDFTNVDIDYDLGFASLRAISGFARSKIQDRDDCAGLPNFQDCVREILPSQYRQWSQEFQLVSNAAATFDWLIGMNYFESDESTRFFQFTPFINSQPTFDSLSTDEVNAYAIFGQLTTHLTEKWAITGGLRLSYENNRVTSIGSGTADNPVLTAAEDNWDHLSWRFDLEYAATDDRLYYAGVSTGFKSGGIRTVRRPSGEFDTFDSENLTAYEVGIKSRWQDRRLTLNGAAFFYDFDDLQVGTLFFTPNQPPILLVENAAKTEVYGIDAAGSFRISDRWTISGAAVWLPKREFTDFRDSPVGGNLSGKKINRAPEWTATASIDFVQTTRRSGSLSARLECQYRTDFFYTQDNEMDFAHDAFGLLNLLLRFEPERENWYVFASGRNLTDEDYYTQVFIQASPGYPDTYEIGFGLRF